MPGTLYIHHSARHKANWLTLWVKAPGAATQRSQRSLVRRVGQIGCGVGYYPWWERGITVLAE